MQVHVKARLHNGSSVQIENSVTWVTAQHHMASLVIPNSTHLTEFSVSISQPLKILIFCIPLFLNNMHIDILRETKIKRDAF